MYLHIVGSWRKFAPRCCVCKQPIMPEPGQEETVRVVALDRSFHIQCYKCEVSRTNLVKNFLQIYNKQPFRIVNWYCRPKLKVEAVIHWMIMFYVKVATRKGFKRSRTTWPLNFNCSTIFERTCNGSSVSAKNHYFEINIYVYINKRI